MRPPNVRVIVATVIALAVILYTPNVRQCSTDSNCAAVWDDTSGLPY